MPLAELIRSHTQCFSTTVRTANDVHVRASRAAWQLIRLRENLVAMRAHRQCRVPERKQNRLRENAIARKFHHDMSSAELVFLFLRACLNSIACQFHQGMWSTELGFGAIMRSVSDNFYHGA